MASKKNVAAAGETEVAERPATVTFIHNNDEGEEMTVTLANDNRAAEYKRTLRENGKHFTVE